MGFLDRLFGKKKEEPAGRSEKPAQAQSPSHQLPSNIVEKEFGEVNVRKTRDGTEVGVTFMMEPEGVEAEGWQTGVALDGSASMRYAYGHGLLEGPAGPVPESVLRDYFRKGWVQNLRQDGRETMLWGEDGYNDAIRRGHFTLSENVVEPVAREMTAYLAGSLDADGGTTVIYWACGDGKAYQVIGDLTAESCGSVQLAGPTEHPFGSGTHLLPAVKYFVDRFDDAARGMYLFVTDGKIDDLNAVKKYTTDLAKRIQGKKRNPVKCVLIGIGDEIDEGQMEELDDLDTGTDVDIWDHKIAKEMRALVEIFAEVVSENQIVAPTATIFDDKGGTIIRYTDGLPAKITFTVPNGSDAFELEVGQRRIKQTIRMPAS